MNSEDKILQKLNEELKQNNDKDKYIYLSNLSKELKKDLHYLYNKNELQQLLIKLQSEYIIDNILKKGKEKKEKGAVLLYKELNSTERKILKINNINLKTLIKEHNLDKDMQTLKYFIINYIQKHNTFPDNSILYPKFRLVLDKSNGLINTLKEVGLYSLYKEKREEKKENQVEKYYDELLQLKDVVVNEQLTLGEIQTNYKHLYEILNKAYKGAYGYNAFKKDFNIHITRKEMNHDELVNNLTKEMKKNGVLLKEEIVCYRTIYAINKYHKNYINYIKSIGLESEYNKKYRESISNKKD